MDVVITEEGMSLLETIDKNDEYMMAVCKSLTQTEMQELNKLLDKFRD